jgi:alkanesulfonate monooxygenase SsuD/methylene tetrahydromethanopterin reductase-like flavin-dependent oxidoreductase (luciferase family)
METKLGLAFPPALPPERIRPVVELVAQAGLDEIWFSEDCFKEGGVSAVASALSWTEGTGLVVGAGLLPVPLRNVAATAMEAATLERLHPGRFRLCIGHGVQPWMEMTGAAVASPLTLLREYAGALRAEGGLSAVTVQPTSQEPDLAGFVRMLGRDVRPALMAD